VGYDVILFGDSLPAFRRTVLSASSMVKEPNERRVLEDLKPQICFSMHVHKKTIGICIKIYLPPSKLSNYMHYLLYSLKSTLYIWDSCYSQNKQQ
jgi:hypothetical protein